MKDFFRIHKWKLSDFVIKKELGNGRASTVFLAVHIRTGMELVLKKCKIENDIERNQVHNEIKIHSEIEHPRVISFYGHFYDSDGAIYLMLEHAKCGDVWQMITDSQQTEEEFRDRVMRPIVCALMHVHSLGITHRDIKPENIFLTEKRNGVKLGDFGFAADEKTLKIQRMGTKEYMAPEILLCDPEKREKARTKNRNLYDNKVDCWAIGILAYEGLVGITPWDTNGTMEDYLMNIIMNPFVEQPGISKEANDFICKCLQFHRENRMSAIEMLAHPWLQRSSCLQPIKNCSVQNNIGNIRANTFQNGMHSLYPQHRKKDEQKERGNTVMNGTAIAHTREELMDVKVRNGKAFAHKEFDDDSVRKGTAFTQTTNREREFKGCLPNIFSRKNRLKTR